MYRGNITHAQASAHGSNLPSAHRIKQKGFPGPPRSPARFHLGLRDATPAGLLPSRDTNPPFPLLPHLLPPPPGSDRHAPGVCCPGKAHTPPFFFGPAASTRHTPTPPLYQLPPQDPHTPFGLVPQRSTQTPLPPPHACCLHARHAPPPRGSVAYTRHPCPS